MFELSVLSYEFGHGHFPSIPGITSLNHLQLYTAHLQPPRHNNTQLTRDAYFLPKGEWRFHGSKGKDMDFRVRFSLFWDVFGESLPFRGQGLIPPHTVHREV